jgi:hypothetical protein
LNPHVLNRDSKISILIARGEGGERRGRGCALQCISFVSRIKKPSSVLRDIIGAIQNA